MQIKTKKNVLFRKFFYLYQNGTENKDNKENKEKLVGFFKNKENQENKEVWAAWIGFIQIFRYKNQCVAASSVLRVVYGIVKPRNFHWIVAMKSNS